MGVHSAYVDAFHTRILNTIRTAPRELTATQIAANLRADRRRTYRALLSLELQGRVVGIRNPAVVTNRPGPGYSQPRPRWRLTGQR